jgi:hypothetical protein
LSQDQRGYELDMTAHITSPLYYNRASSPISEICDLKPTGGVGLRVQLISIKLHQHLPYRKDFGVMSRVRGGRPAWRPGTSPSATTLERQGARSWLARGISSRTSRVSLNSLLQLFLRGTWSASSFVLLPSLPSQRSKFS